ncbi:MAG: hypothetical protein ACOCQC_02800 [Halanaerobiaceae bacterium]
MNSKKETSLVKKALQEGEGILRLKPSWVPRTFLSAGGRLKLDPDDLYPLGTERGGICERWIASTTQADNGPETEFDEGLSYIYLEGEGEDKEVLLKDAIEIMGDKLLGKEYMSEYGGWNVLTKFFDYKSPIHHHVHLTDEDAAKVGAKGKPESYYFPKQMNMVESSFPYTFFGLVPGTSKQDVIDCLEKWYEGDNGILYLSRAYKLKPGTGWYLPAGILHAPGNMVTYEVQRASDVLSMFQSMAENRPTSYDLLVKDIPEEHHDDLEYIVNILDWEANVDKDFYQNHYREPQLITPSEQIDELGYQEKWTSYGSEYFSGKELTVFPGESVVITDSEAYGVIAVQGVGKIGSLTVQTPAIIGYGERTKDEFFVTKSAAQKGVEVTNTGDEDLVLLKHFGPGNADNPIE